MTIQKRTTLDNEQDIPLVLVLDETSARLGLVGGKGSSLALMAAAGLPVPQGFHITTLAYRRFAQENGLQEQILAAVSGIAKQVTTHHSAEPEEISRRIVQLFEQGIIPDDIAEA